MVDLNASFFHHLLELAVADRVRHIPAHTPKDDHPLKMTTFEIDHRGALRCQTDHDHSPTGLGAQLCDRTPGWGSRECGSGPVGLHSLD